jgi:uncharacterized protein (DUF1499 family)
VKYLASILLLLVVLVCLLVLGILLHNRAQLFTAPGPVERLKVYFTQNSVQTSAQNRFPELRSAVFQVDSARLYRAVQTALVELGWSQSPSFEVHTHEHLINAVVTTPVFKFKDDVVIIVHDQRCEQGALHSALDMRSSSRIGRGDLAANAGHVQSLFAQVALELDHQVPAQPQSSPCH